MPFTINLAGSMSFADADPLTAYLPVVAHNKFVGTPVTIPTGGTFSVAPTIQVLTPVSGTKTDVNSNPLSGWTIEAFHNLNGDVAGNPKQPLTQAEVNTGPFDATGAVSSATTPSTTSFSANVDGDFAVGDSLDFTTGSAAGQIATITNISAGAYTVSGLTVAPAVGDMFYRISAAVDIAATGAVSSATTPSTTSFSANVTGTLVAGDLVKFTAGSAAGQTATITNVSGNLYTVTGLTSAPSVGDAFQSALTTTSFTAAMTPSGVLAVGDWVQFAGNVTAGIATNQAQITAINGDQFTLSSPLSAPPASGDMLARIQIAVTAANGTYSIPLDTGPANADNPSGTPANYAVVERLQPGWNEAIPNATTASAFLAFAAVANAAGIYGPYGYAIPIAVGTGAVTGENFQNNTIANLVVTKVGVPNPVSAGSDLTYTITVTNNGPADALQMALTDPVPTDTTFVSVVLPTGWSRTDTVPVGGTGTLDFSDGTLPDGKSVTFTLVVQVDPGTPGGTSITNVATATSPTAPNPAPGTATNTVVASAALVVTKVGQPNPVSAGSDLTYTITVTNHGPADALQMALTDPVPTDTTFVSVVLPTGWSRTDAVPVGGTGTLDFSDGTLPDGKSVTFTLVVQVDPGTPGGTVITNVATATSPTAPNPATGTTTNTVASAALVVSKVGQPNPVTAGSDLTYTITVTNNGPADALQMAMTDPVPTDTTFVSVVLPTGWSRTDAVPVGGTGTLDFSDGTLPDGKSVTFTLVVQVDPGTPGGTIITNVATATSPTAPNPAPGTATNTVSNSGSLSGYVYDDANENGVYDRGSANPLDNEFGLPNVTVSLLLNGSTTQVTTTGSDGLYDFEGLAAGTYQIVETQPADFQITKLTLGGVLPLNVRTAAPTASGQIGTNQFSNIQLTAGEEGVNYSFGEMPTVVTKRMFLAKSSPAPGTLRGTGRHRRHDQRRVAQRHHFGHHLQPTCDRHDRRYYAEHSDLNGQCCLD